MPHIHEKIDFTVEVFIVYKNKVLLRMHEKYHRWLSVGGHIELDESPIEAAIREVKEEVGLDVIISGNLPPVEDESDYKHLIAPRYFGCSYVNDTHRHMTFVYFATSETDVITESVYDHEKKCETRWLTKEELESMDLRPNILFYATKALEELGE